MWKDLLETSFADFARAASFLSDAGELDLGECRRQVLALMSDHAPTSVSNILYLLAEVGRADMALALGEDLLSTLPGEEAFIIAVADILHRKGNLWAACEWTRQHMSPSASDHLLNKHCDLLRDVGLGFVAEQYLEEEARAGRTFSLGRLAEHHREQRNWLALYRCVSEIPSDLATCELLYLRGRAAVSLLLEQEVIATADRLWLAPEAGPAYAQLLLDIWRWRIGEIEKDPPEPPNVELSYWAMEDARSIGCAPAPNYDTGTVVRSLSGWRALRPRENLPNLLMIGSQRAATTWLWQNLLRHPGVQPLPWKESVFFSDAFGSPFDVDPGLAAAAIGEDMTYWTGPTRNLFRYCRLYGAGFPIRADFSPTYAELPDESVDVLRDLLGPDVCILFCVRDLVDRAWSNLKFDLKLSGINIENVDLQGRIAHYTSDIAMRRADYATIIDRWKTRFRNFHLLFFDDIISDPARAMESVEQLIGIAGTDEVGQPVLVSRINESAGNDLPSEDRAFLLGLHLPNYRRATRYIGQRAEAWVARHQTSLSSSRCNG